MVADSVQRDMADPARGIVVARDPPPAHERALERVLHCVFGDRWVTARHCEGSDHGPVALAKGLVEVGRVGSLRGHRAACSPLTRHTSRRGLVDGRKSPECCARSGSVGDRELDRDDGEAGDREQPDAEREQRREERRRQGLAEPHRPLGLRGIGAARRSRPRRRGRSRGKPSTATQIGKIGDRVAARRSRARRRRARARCGCRRAACARSRATTGDRAPRRRPATTPTGGMAASCPIAARVRIATARHAWHAP